MTLRVSIPYFMRKCLSLICSYVQLGFEDGNAEAEFRDFFEQVQIAGGVDKATLAPALVTSPLERQAYADHLNVASIVLIPLSIAADDPLYAIFCMALSLGILSAGGAAAAGGRPRGVNYGRRLLPAVSTVIHLSTGRLHLFAQNQ